MGTESLLLVIGGMVMFVIGGCALLLSIAGTRLSKYDDDPHPHVVNGRPVW